MGDLEDQGEINISGKRSVPVNDLKSQFQFTKVGWELDNFHDVMETDQDNWHMFEMPCLFYAGEFSSMRMVGWKQAKNISSMSTMIELD